MQDLARRLAAPLFALAMFTSAALIFVLQPLFARMVTPLLGGSPAVWNASMAFFQAALLAGYVYAHLLARIADLRVQALIHALVLGAAWLVLPVSVSQALGPPDPGHPALWLVGVLALSVGAPFAAASATAPLLQAWFARTGRADAHDPYYLYAASNLGSFGGLLAYPVAIEPLFGAAAQSAGWSAGYALACALIACCAAAALAAGAAAPQRADADGEAALTWRRRLYWAGAAAVPSALVLGVTLHISTDVASAPLLWVVPLALYLFTFVIAFSRGAERIAPLLRFLYAPALALLVLSYFAARREWPLMLGGNLAGFFVAALVCHLALAAARPHVARLTEFYFWVSLGGVAGGAFAAFAAPVLFDNVYEYPLALAAAALFLRRADSDAPPARLEDAAAAAAVAMTLVVLLLAQTTPAYAALVAGGAGAAAALIAAAWAGANDGRIEPLRVVFLVFATLLAALVIVIGFNIRHVFAGGAAGEQASLTQPWRLLLIGAAMGALAFVAHAAVQAPRPGERIARIALGAAAAPITLLVLLGLMQAQLNARAIVALALGFAAAAMLINRRRPLVLAALVLAAFAAVFVNEGRGVRVMTQARTFFGVLRTEVITESTGPDVPEFRVLMHGTTLHGAQLIGAGASRTPLTYYNPNTALGEAVLAGVVMGESSNVALIGLGTGTTACLIQPADRLTIYEIDPMVVRLSGPRGSDFTYVQECQPEARVELGDARLRIAEAPDGAYDVILVDAFSSDAIPAHLLTREAVAMYLAKTSARGIVVLHLSNRHLALVSEAARVARDLGVAQRWRVSEAVREGPAGSLTASVASVMIVARDPLAIEALPLASLDWREFPAPPGRAWTDDYINLPRALWEAASGAEECRMYPGAEGCAPASED